MKFKIIPNQQTPKLKPVENTIEYINANYKMLCKFVSFAMRQSDCIGLASNQTSINGNRVEGRFFAIKCNGRWDVVIDPKIIKRSGKAEEKIEGCKSWIGRKLIAKRHNEIKVTGYDINKKMFSKTVSEIEAQIWQHECDHLNGVEEVFSS